MANELTIGGAQPNSTIVAVTRKDKNETVWRTDTGVFEVWNDINFENGLYDESLVEQGTSGYFVGDFDIRITQAGNYNVSYYTINNGQHEYETTVTIAWNGIATPAPTPTQQTGLRAVSDIRGSFLQGQRATMFLRITSLDGFAKDVDDITVVITDTNNNQVFSGVPEHAYTGFYAMDWDVPQDQTPNNYNVLWSYVFDGENKSATQSIVISATNIYENPPSLYTGRILQFRQSLELMIGCAQSIPVYSEPAKASADARTYMFSFPRWNQSPGCRLYLNDDIVTDGVTIDYFKGRVYFDSPLTRYDRIKVDYNFRWFSDEQLDRFLSNATSLVNLWPPVTKNMNLMNLKEQYIPLVLYAAAVDAIRNMMMCLNFQQPQMVFGGPDGASKAYSNLEGLKKNYEETLNAGLEQKKNGPYTGLTRTIVTPEFALPGGRSRWFRYLFSNGAGS